MKRALKWLAWTIAGLVVLLAALAFAAQILSDRKMHRRIDIAVQPVAYVSEPQALERGRYLFASRGCAECHGSEGRGKVMLDTPDGLFVRTPDLTPAGPTGKYSERDWVRAVRHGVKPSGQPMLIMPTEDFNRLTDEDLAAIVAYTRSLAPGEGRAAEMRLPLPVRALYAAGFVQDGAEKVDHTLPPSRPVPAAITLEHGAYVAYTCAGCHGEHLSGGKIPGGPPDWPAAANLTPGDGSAMRRYDTPEKFVAMMRSGRRPDGSAVSPVMPFAMLKEMNDTDLQALYLHLKQLPPRPAGQR